MKKFYELLPWEALGPIIFLLIGAGLCFLLPMEHRKDVILLLVGAALTRVKRVNGGGSQNK